MSKKTDKQPDEFVSTMEQIVQVIFKDHKQTTQIVLGLAVAILIAATAFHYHTEKKMNDWAEKIYQTKLLSPKDKITKFEALIKEKSPKDLKAYFYLELGKNYLKENRKEDAIKAYREVYKMKNPALKALSGLSLASLLAEEKKYEEAEGIYHSLSQDKKLPLQNEAKLQLIRVLFASGKKDLAKSKIKEMEAAKKDLNPALQSSLRELKLSFLLQEKK